MYVYVWCVVCGVCLRGGPLLVKLVVEVFGRVMRMRVHTWRLRGGRRRVVVGGVARRAAVRRALPQQPVTRGLS